MAGAARPCGRASSALTSSGSATCRSLPAPSSPEGNRRAGRNSRPRIYGSAPASHRRPSTLPRAIRHGRHRASRPREIRLACSSTFRCLEIAGRLMAKGSASSVTDVSPRASLARIARRVGSARCQRGWIYREGIRSQVFAGPHIRSMAFVTIASRFLRGTRARARMAMV